MKEIKKDILEITPKIQNSVDDNESSDVKGQNTSGDRTTGQILQLQVWCSFYHIILLPKN